MAKFCGNCGAQMEENETRCKNCGQVVDGEPVKTQNVNSTDQEKPKKVKIILTSTFILALVAVVFIVAFNVISNFTGYKGLIRKIMNACEDGDFDTLMSLSSGMYYSDGENWLDNFLEATLDNYSDSFESSADNDYKMTYKINETRVMPDDELDQMIDKMTSLFSNFDVDTIEKVVEADLTVTIKQDKKTVDRDMNIIMTKEDGKWKWFLIQ